MNMTFLFRTIIIGILTMPLSFAATNSGLSDEEFALTQYTPEQAQVYIQETTRRLGNLTLLPPVVNTNPLPEYDYDQLDYGMVLGSARTPGGRLWSAWVAGEDGPRAFMVANSSDDNGKTWSKPRFVIDSQSKDLPMPRSVIIGNFWTDPQGRLWFFFDQSMNHYDGRSGTWCIVSENPDADNPTWSKPQRIWHGSVLNKPTVLSNGEWLLPVELPNIRPRLPNAFPELADSRGANTLVSRDSGKTWEVRGKVTFPNSSWDEQLFVELEDGRIWMVARTGRAPMQSFSADGGHTWSEPENVSFSHPAARFQVVRLASGNILLVKHGEKIDSHDGRSKLTAWLSKDEGKSWLGGLMLDERKGVSYPDAFQGPDGMIYITYDRNRGTDGEILMAQIFEEDILARKLINKDSSLKQLVSKPLRNKLATPELEKNADGAPLLLAEGTQFSSPNAEVRTLENGTLIYNNRNYRFHSVPEELNGKRFLFTSLGRTDAVCTADGVAYVFTPRVGRNSRGSVESELIRQGFVRTNLPEFVYTLVRGQPRLKEACSVYQKKVKKGDRVQFGNWGILAF